MQEAKKFKKKKKKKGTGLWLGILNLLPGHLKYANVNFLPFILLLTCGPK